MRIWNGMIDASFAALATTLVVWLMFALGTLFDGFPKLRIRQILGIVAVSAFVMAIGVAMGPEGPIILLIFTPVVSILLLFAGMWAREFRLLMSRRSDEFPDWYDKLAWIFVLTVLAPAGVWLFRSYRRARWPEAIKVDRPHPLDEQDPVLDVSEMQRIGA